MKEAKTDLQLGDLVQNSASTQCFYARADETARATRIIRTYGFVILRDAVPRPVLEPLRVRMDQDTEELVAYCETIGGNPREKGHLQQGPPPTREYVFEEVAMNSFVGRVCSELLGPNPKLTFYNGNTNYPGSVRQALHMDGVHHNKAPEDPLPTASVVVNFCPCDANESNGAVELWPGSHLVRPESERNYVPESQEEARRKVEPPISANTELGDVLIRDVRVWHRGVPNRSSRPRHMIALIVSRSDLQPNRRLKFENGCEHALEGHEVQSNAEYVDSVADYLLGPTRRIHEHRQERQRASRA